MDKRADSVTEATTPKPSDQLRRPVLALGGVTVVLLLVTCGRWGAYIGLPDQGIFLTDVLLLLAIGRAVLTKDRFVRLIPVAPQYGRASMHRGPGVSIALLTAYATVRLAAGIDFTAVALRDAAPYIYAGVAFLSASAYYDSTLASQRRTIRFFDLGLRLHIVWVLLALLLPQVIANLPTIGGDGRVQFLSLRPDFDSAMIAVLVGITCGRALTHRWRRLDAAFAVAGIVEVATMGSRAGILAVGAAVVITALLIVAKSADSAGSSARKTLVLIAVPVALITAAAFLPSTFAGSRLLVSLNLRVAQTESESTGIGTQQARGAAWDRVEQYTLAEPWRSLFGVGFGPDFMRDSGADVLLVGATNTDVRSPHNYIIGTFARLGFVGVAAVTMVIMSAVRETVRLRALLVDDELLLFATLVGASIVVVSAVGVDLESPFGAIPFFWAIGILLSRPAITYSREAGSYFQIEAAHAEARG